jgi:secreted trypsin-like serine protease
MYMKKLFGLLQVGIISLAFSPQCFGSFNLSIPAKPIFGGEFVTSSDPVAQVTVMIYGRGGSAGDFICSGTIIAEDVILTAAHCLGKQGDDPLTVVFGTSLSRPKNSFIKVKKQIRPHNYQANLRDDADFNMNDIALLLLQKPIPNGYKVAKILPDASAIRDGAEVLLAGYGIDMPSVPRGMDGGDGTLRKVTQEITDANYSRTEVLISVRGKGSCDGDSGGPAFIQRDGQLYLFGVVSRTTVNFDDRDDMSCSTDMVYTNVLAAESWINSTMLLLRKE